MQYVYKQYAVVASVVLAASLAGQAMAQGAKIGIVDRNKVITSFTKAQQAATELKGQEDKVRNLLETSNKKYEEAKAAKKTAAELKALQDNLQKQIDTEYKAAQNRAKTLEDQLESDIDKAIKDEATANSLDTVLIKDSVLLGGTDITAGVIKRLPASASAATKATTTK